MSAADTPSQSSRGALQSLRSPVVAWSILGVSLALTALAWWVADRQVTQRASDNFAAQVEEAQGAITARMLEYEQVLRGGVALHAASDQVTRADWRAYHQALKLEQIYPGLQGFGYALWIAPQERLRTIEAVRADGLPDFTLRPAGERAETTAIVFLEPQADRNLRALGYDMWSEAVRREAMARARDSGAAALSGRFTLVQETEQQPQPGVLMYLPVYRHGAAVDTVERRRDALQGFVYSPFRMYDLMRGILGERDPEVAYQIFDGLEAVPGSLLFDSARYLGALPANYVPAFSRNATIEIAGRPWTLQFHSLPAFDAASASKQPLMIAFGGGLVDLLLFFAIWQLWLQRERSDVAAQAALAESRRADQRSRQIVESSPNAVVMVDASGRIVLVNAQAERLFGWPRDELLGRPVETLVPRRVRPGHPALRAGFHAAPQWRPMGERKELHAVRKDGSEFPVEIGLNPIDTADGPMVLAAVADISERKAVQQRIESALQEKPVLLNEVHHRVKNNLQVVSSLLSLQSGAGDGPHPSVEGQGFSLVDLGQYLRGLVRLVQDSYRDDAARITLRLDVMQPVVLDLQRAVPCGLLVNELISNAYKHAFPDGRDGRITITLALEDDGQAVLTVCDDGIGLPPGRAALDPPTLGLQLVHMLASQINGRLALMAASSGACFELRFVATEPEPAPA